jgi:hypothetical protein
MSESLTHVAMSSEVYEKAKQYAIEHGFPTKVFIQRACLHAIEHDLAAGWLQKFRATPTAPSPRKHDLAKDIARAEIKEMTKPARAIVEGECLSVDDIMNGEV